jgi:hypothetical protein
MISPKNYNLKQGDIVFSFRKDNLLSRLIAWFTRSRFSHVSIVHLVGDGYCVISEATIIGIRFNLIDYYLENTKISVEVWNLPGLTDTTRKTIVDSAYNLNKNESYGFLQFFSYAIRALLKKMKINIKNFIRQGVVCNQYVAYGYKKSGISWFDMIDPEAIDQEDFYRLIQKIGFKKVLTSNE